jgi:hypothetical protein
MLFERNSKVLLHRVRRIQFGIIKPVGLHKFRIHRIKLWQRMGLSKKQYLTQKPWKYPWFSREKYERIVSVVPQEYLDEVRITGQAEMFAEKVLGQP